MSSSYTETTTTTEVHTRSTEEINDFVNKLSATGIQDALALDELKQSYERLLERFHRVNQELIAAETKLEKYEGIDVDQLKREHTEFKAEIRGLKRQAENYRQDYESERKRVETHEKTIRTLMQEYKSFKESIFEFLKLDKTVITKSTREVINYLQAALKMAKDGMEELERLKVDIEKYKTRIQELEDEVARLRSEPKVQVDDGKIAKLTEERHNLELRLEREMHKYQKLVHEVKIYREESTIESKLLQEELANAKADLEEIQSTVKIIFDASSRAQTAATRVTSVTMGAMKHRCKHTTSVLEVTSVEESVSITRSRSDSTSSSERSLRSY